MNAKQLWRLVLVLVVGMAAWAAAALANRSSRNDEGRRLVPPIDTGAVDTVVSIAGRDTAVVARVGRTRWEVNGYRASAFAMGQLLRGLVDSATTAELVAVSRSSHAEFGLAGDSARRVRIASGGRTLLELIAGTRAPTGGVYVRHADDSTTYLLRGSLIDPLTQAADAWHERTIATIPTDSVDAVEIGRGATSYTLRRDDRAWTITGSTHPSRPADSAAVAELLARFRTVAATAFATKVRADSLRFDPPDRRAKLVGRNGKLLASFVFDSTASGVWLRHDSGGPAYLIDSWTAARMAPGEDAFRP